MTRMTKQAHELWVAGNQTPNTETFELSGGKTHGTVRSSGSPWEDQRPQTELSAVLPNIETATLQLN